jgi:tetratricopeptide (TPR) repeat protein
MEYIKGIPILQYCDQEKLDTRARLELFTSVCHAIQHAHHKGIIHRDIKPSNVLVTLHDGVPVPKVIDFGIAKATNSELTTRTLFTEHRQMIGTPAYMSPEQAEMSGLDIDTRSDVYSLGVLLYELLTGTTPFSDQELRSAGFVEMMRIIREVEPHKPSTRLSTLGQTATRTAQQRHADVGRLGSMLRGDLDWIVMKCLEKDRTRRYETANGLAADIARHLRDEPVTAGPPSSSYRLRKFVRRNRPRVIAACALVVALISGLLGGSWGLIESNRARSIRLRHDLETQQRAAADNARLARNAEAVGSLLLQCEEALRAGGREKARVALDAARKRSDEGGAGKDAERLAHLAKDLDLLVDLDAVDRIRWAWTIEGHAESQQTAIAANRDALKKFGIGRGVASVESMAVAVNGSAVHERIVAALDWLLWASRGEETTEIHAVLRRADSDPFRNEFRDALLARDDANEAKTEVKMVELVNRLEALEQPAAFTAFMGGFNQIGVDMDRRAKLLRTAVLRRPKDMNLLMALGRRALDSGPNGADEAMRWSQAAIAADPTNPGGYSNLGVSLKMKGRLDEAIACYRKAIEVEPKAAMAYMNMANALDEAGRIDEALANHRKAIENDPKDFECYCTLGSTLCRHGRLDEALNAAKKAIELNPKHAPAYVTMASTLLQQGRLAEATASYQKAIELEPKNFRVYADMGAALRNQGRLNEAVATFEKAIELNPKDGQTLTNLGGVLADLGRKDEAIAPCKKAIECDPNLAMAYYNLGSIYAADSITIDDGIANYRKAIELNPNYAEAHCNLAQALDRKGEYAEALAEYRRGHELGSVLPDWKYPSAEWVRQAESKVGMLAKLPALLKGDYQPVDNAERLGLALICQNRKFNHAALGLYAAGLEADPKAGENVEECVRYNAASVAALSAAGEGEDAAGLGEDDRRRLRRQALDWLRADLNVAARRLKPNGAPTDAWSRWFCDHSLNRNPDLKSIRDPAALAKLPAQEQVEFRQLWADAAALLKRAEAPIPKAAGADSPPAEKDERR